LLLKAVYHLPLRGTQGFVESSTAQWTIMDCSPSLYEARSPALPLADQVIALSNRVASALFI